MFEKNNKSNINRIFDLLFFFHIHYVKIMSIIYIEIFG